MSFSSHPTTISRAEGTIFANRKKYNPPAGLVATKRIAATESDASLIDCSVLEADPALELWAIRVPVGVRIFHFFTTPPLTLCTAQIKSKHLEGLTIQLPANSTTNSPNVLTTFSAKRTSYDICLADTDDVTKAGKRKRDAGDDGAEHVRVGGQEMKALVPMLPKRSSGDRLFLGESPPRVSPYIDLLVVGSQLLDR